MFSPKIPEYQRWKQEADAYAEGLLSGLAGEAKEEIEVILGSFKRDIRDVEFFVRGIRGYDMDEIVYAERSMHENIHDLKNDYGIKDTEPLEKIQQELAEWLHERRMEQHPGQAHGPAPHR
jgi:hypothetical protein